MLVVADSSPLRYLIVIGQSELLPRIFGEVVIPTAVVDELSTEASPEEVRRLMERSPARLRRRDAGGNALASVSSAWM